MSKFVHLGPLEWPEDRPFTDPRLAATDRAVLIGLIHDLHAARHTGGDVGGHGRDRLIATAAGRAYGDAPVSVVGFFGHRRADGCLDVADQVESVNAEMVADFDMFPLLLGYVSRKLPDSLDYANLVVLKGDDGIERWRDLPKHVTAVMTLAPKYYSSVRIYNGSLPHGLSHGDELQLRSVKFWDYRDSDVWQAMRWLSSGS